MISATVAAAITRLTSFGCRGLRYHPTNGFGVRHDAHDERTSVRSPYGIIMTIPGPRTIVRRLKTFLARNPDRFLKRASGLIHIGANTGAERDLYKRYRLRVIWIEPIPEVFEALKANLEGYSGQVPLQALVTDQDNSVYNFHISSNGGASSSILDLKMHKDIWPEVTYEKTIALSSITLTSLLKREHINPREYDALIMDTQGSELLVLKGADTILDGFRFVKTEAADFESYAGCCQLRDIDQFLKQRGFREVSRHELAKHPGGGRYYDITYARDTRRP
jgi:2-O-methyltransferase